GREAAEHLLYVFREMKGKTRGEMAEEVQETIGDTPAQLVHQGLSKLLEDSCEFEVDSELEPEELREKVFLAAAEARRSGTAFDRAAILARVATEANTTADVVDRG